MAAHPLDALVSVMARLRSPEGGCPWDREQTFASIAPYTLEEAYEVADAIARGDLDNLREELGDLLFQVVFHARMAEEQEVFAINDVIGGIVDKMIRRHPHVFGDATVADAAEQTRAWEALKAAEKAERASDDGSLLDGVPVNLPGLTRAVKLQRKAARVGFDWPEVSPVFAKVAEEANELQRAHAEDAAVDAIEEELGDLLFACANLARHLELDPEAALRRANLKFAYRFRRIEERLREEGKEFAETDAAELDRLWELVKKAERRSTD